MAFFMAFPFPHENTLNLGLMKNVSKAPQNNVILPLKNLKDFCNVFLVVVIVHGITTEIVSA